MGIFNKKKKNGAFNANDLQKTLHENLKFSAIEQYKLLRTNLAFTLSRHVKCPVIGVTSSVKGEGKTTTALNLSYVLSESDKRVLLIDADCRMPSVAMKMGIDGSRGLTDLLMGEAFDENSYRSSLRKNWFVLPAGTYLTEYEE
jgi:Mrp family chromosome partitioning ATPase